MCVRVHIHVYMCILYTYMHTYVYTCVYLCICLFMCACVCYLRRQNQRKRGQVIRLITTSVLNHSLWILFLVGAQVLRGVVTWKEHKCNHAQMSNRHIHMILISFCEKTKKLKSRPASSPEKRRRRFDHLSSEKKLNDHWPRTDTDAASTGRRTA